MYKSKLLQETSKLEHQARVYKNAGNTIAAINCLKLKKLKQHHTDHVYESLLNVQSMIANIHNKEHESTVLNALSLGKQELAKLHSLYSLEKVMDLMDGVREQNELENEINQALVNMGADMVSDSTQELENDLKELMAVDNFVKVEKVDNESIQLALPVAPETELRPIAATIAEKDQVPSKKVAVAS